MKRSAPLRRKTPLRHRSARAVRPRTCPGCKFNTLQKCPDPQWVEICPGYSYLVPVPGALHCGHCGHVHLSRTARALAWERAYHQHCQMILERDQWTCQRCGRGGPGSGVPVEVAHKVGLSRARCPGPMKHHPDHLELACVDCHRSEHAGT